MSGRNSFNLIAACTSLSLVLLLASSCGRSSAPSPATGAGSSAPPTLLPSPELWGNMTPIVSVKELMRDLIDPLADYIFDAISTSITRAGTVDRFPKTDADWDRFRIGGTAMAETSYLLKVRRPFTPKGDLNNSFGPDAVELSPDEIMAKVQKDPVEWNSRIETLRNVGLEVIEISKKKDVSQLWNVAEDLDVACESCHRSYWYPKETDEWYSRMDGRLKKFSDEEEASRARKK